MWGKNDPGEYPAQDDDAIRLRTQLCMKDEWENNRDFIIDKQLPRWITPNVFNTPLPFYATYYSNLINVILPQGSNSIMIKGTDSQPMLNHFKGDCFSIALVESLLSRLSNYLLCIY